MARSKRTQKRLRVLLAGAFGCAIIAATVYVTLIQDRRPAVAIAPRPLAATKQQSVSVDAATPDVVNRSLPARLIIPKLNITTNVEYMGLTKNGEMQVPSNVHDVGWYKYGPLPGNKGSAVMTGHLDGQKGEPGVFTDLEKLEKGDTLSVVDDKDQAVLFVVREIKIYGQHEHPDEVFNSTDGVHLNLITCTGTWNKDQRRFSQRLVVFTDQVI